MVAEKLRNDEEEEEEAGVVKEIDGLEGMEEEMEKDSEAAQDAIADAFGGMSGLGEEPRD